MQQSAKDFDLVVVGEINPDLILRGDVVPAFGQVEKLVDDATLTIGSSAAIFACGAARLGLRTAFIGKTGADEFGRFMVEALQQRGVDTSGVVIDPAVRTGLSVILSAGSDRAILTFLGAIPALRYDEIRPGVLGRARHLHLASYFMQSELRPDVPRLFDQAHEMGMSVSLDTNYDPAEIWDGGLAEALPRCDVFLPNTTEACAITRLDDPLLARDALAARTGLVAVKLGANGATARQGGHTASAESVPVQVIDTVGAGDSFDAGFIYGYLNGWDLTRSLRLGAVCGALSTRAAGGTEAQPTLSEANPYLVRPQVSP